MAKVQVFDMSKKAVAEREISDAVFNADVKEYLIHDMVRYQLAKRRSGTATVKSRAAVAGGGKKPYKQKGTGNARQGTIRAPHFVGGGVAFGPQQRSYEFKLNRKVKQAALRSALSVRFKENQLYVVDQINLDAPSTKNLLEFLGAFEADNALVVVESANSAVELSARNLEKIKVLRSEGVNVYDVMKHQKLILSAGAVANLEGVLG